MKSSNKLIGAIGAAGLALGAFSTVALASEEDDRKFGYSITLTGVSDYIFRGISFTNEKPAFQPYLEFTYGIAYVGFWGSNIGDSVYGDGSIGPWEVDYYAGLRPTWMGVNWDLGVLYYTYGERGGGFGENFDYVEFQIAASYALRDNVTLGLKGYWSPDAGVAYPTTGTIEGSVAYVLPKFSVSSAEWVPTLSGIVGYTDSATTSNFPDGAFLGEQNYTYWNAGLKINVDKFFMDFRYWDTTIEDDLADARFVFSAGVTLP